MKKNIRQKHRSLIKQDIVNGKSIEKIAKKYGYTYSTVDNYIKSRALKFVEINGKKLIRCACCKVYKDEKDYKKFWSNRRNKYEFRSYCEYCDRLKARNKYRIKMNTNPTKTKEEIKIRHRKTWIKHGWRYNIKRKIFRIIA